MSLGEFEWHSKWLFLNQELHQVKTSRDMPVPFQKLGKSRPNKNKIIGKSNFTIESCNKNFLKIRFSKDCILVDFHFFGLLFFAKYLRESQSQLSICKFDEYHCKHGCKLHKMRVHKV